MSNNQKSAADELLDEMIRRGLATENEEGLTFTLEGLDLAKAFERIGIELANAKRMRDQKLQ